MKIRYFIPILALILIISFLSSCNIITKTIPKTIEVMYLILGTADEAFITYNNDQGGIEQMEVNIATDWNPIYDFMREEGSLLYEVKGLENLVGGKEATGGIIKYYDKFPSDNFLYISAQNNGSTGSIVVLIIVNNEVWKSSTSSGAYVIATADGYYN